MMDGCELKENEDLPCAMEWKCIGVEKGKDDDG